MNEKFDFIEQLQKSYLKHMEHILKCGICAGKLADLVREAQHHKRQLIERDIRE